MFKVEKRENGNVSDWEGKKYDGFGRQHFIFKNSNWN